MEAKSLIDLSVRDFVRNLATKDPAPGGGAASALSGALGAALTAMTAGLTIGREKYAAHDSEMRRVQARAQELTSELLALVDADAGAYAGVLDAYRLPHGNEAERAARRNAVEATMQRATAVPVAVAEACVQVLDLAALAVEHGNKNAREDAAAGAQLAHAALLSVVRNARANLATLHDLEFRAATEDRVAGLLAQGELLVERATATRRDAAVPVPA